MAYILSALYILLLVLGLIAVAAVILVALYLSAQYRRTGLSGADHAWKPVSTSRRPRTNETVSVTSKYISMRDGTKIAVDVYLPAHNCSTTFSTIFWQTRYYRSPRLRWPFSVVLGKFFIKTHWHFPRNGFALVVADSRGSGASFGFRRTDLSPEEIDDGREIVDWIVKQSWSNATVGLFGESYDGALATMLLASLHPAVKAAAIIRAPFDLYSDIAFPGGVLWPTLNQQWSAGTRMLDSNRPPHILDRILFKGVKPVGCERSEELLRSAIRQHTSNYNYFEALSRLTYRDDCFVGTTLDAISPHRHAQALSKGSPPVYILGGWYDLFTARPAIALFMNTRSEHNTLVLGPWTHEHLQVRPGRRPRPSSFDWQSQVVRFFKQNLYCSAEMESEAPNRVHFWTQGEDKWNHAPSWPPLDTVLTDYYLSNNQTLKLELPDTGCSPDVCPALEPRSVRPATRWSLDWMLFSRPIRSDTVRGLHYDSDVLDANIEVTGYPVLSIWVQTVSSDAYLFAYLQDIGAGQQSTTVTEGLFRGLHRKPIDISRSRSPIHPLHSFERRDGASLNCDAPVEFRFELFPISYLFLAGHRIRLTLVADDTVNFPMTANLDPPHSVFRGRSYPSRLTVPIRIRSDMNKSAVSREVILSSQTCAIGNLPELSRRSQAASEDPQ